MLVHTTDLFYSFPNVDIPVCSAMGLGGKAVNGKTEIFCVVSMQNTLLRTQSIIKRKSPTWNRSFVL